MQMKYLMYKGMNHIPVLFSAELSHVDMSERCEMLGKLVSAGFVKVENCPPRAYGNSTTLGLSARPEDTDIIRQHLGWEK